MSVQPGRRILEIGDIAQQLLGDPGRSLSEESARMALASATSFGKLLCIGQDIGDHVARRALCGDSERADRPEEIERFGLSL